MRHFTVHKDCGVSAMDIVDVIDATDMVDVIDLKKLHIKSEPM